MVSSNGGGRSRKLFQPLTGMFKTAVRGIFFRPGWYRGNYDVLEKMFRNIRDPWNFEASVYEQQRLDILLDLVKRYPHNRILEVGCAEGVFTERLVSISNNVTAIDVSATAIERASLRCPQARCIQASIEDFESQDSYDIVICAETLYYIRHVVKAINILSGLGRYCLVSFLDREAANLEEYLRDLPIIERQRFEGNVGPFKRGMNVVVWENGIDGQKLS